MIFPFLDFPGDFSRIVVMSTRGAQAENGRKCNAGLFLRREMRTFFLDVSRTRAKREWLWVNQPRPIFMMTLRFQGGWGRREQDARWFRRTRVRCRGESAWSRLVLFNSLISLIGNCRINFGTLFLFFFLWMKKAFPKSDVCVFHNDFALLDKW